MTGATHSHRTGPTGGRKTLQLTIGTGPQDGATIAALRLAARAVERGHRVTIYAYGDGVRVGLTDAPTADHVQALLRAGLHDGTATWIVDRQASQVACAASRQVPGVLAGDGGDLWSLVRRADVALGVSR